MDRLLAEAHRKSGQDHIESPARLTFLLSGGSLWWTNSIELWSVQRHRQNAGRRVARVDDGQ